MEIIAKALQHMHIYIIINLLSQQEQIYFNTEHLLQKA